MRIPLTPICLVLVLVTMSLPWMAHCIAERDLARHHVDEATRRSLVRGPDAFVGDWKVRVSPDPDASRAHQKPYDDVLIFTRGGTFESVALREKGFVVVDYQADTRGMTTNTFTAESTSESQGKIKWTGVVTTGELKGEFQWTKPDGEELRFSYGGERK